MQTHTARLVGRMLVLSATLFVATESSAQVVASPTPQRTQSELVTLPNVAKVSSPGLALSLDATTDEKKGSVAFAFASPDDSLTFSLTATGPLNKDTKEAQPLSLEGLPSSAVVEFGLSWFTWPGKPNAIAVRNFCLSRTANPDCDDDTLSEPDRADYLELTYANRNPWVVSGSASVGRTEFKYVTRADLASGTEHHNDGAVGFSVGQYAPSRGYFAFGYEYQRVWEPAGGARQICVPLATSVSGSEECRTSVVGPPKLGHSHLAKIQWRRFLQAGRLAINPSMTRDFEDGVTAINTPVYFFADANGRLAGGARVGWRSDTESLTFSIFVGTVLSIID